MLLPPHWLRLVLPRSNRSGFTLIELSIALVVIGLIVGGILVGQDLIKSAEVRAQITQIEKFNSAVNTFHGKYNSIPGDMNVNLATQFGFNVGTSCLGNQGQRDGNGLIDGYQAPYTLLQGAGETEMFWQDLTSTAATNLIGDQFPKDGGTSNGCGPIIALSGTQMVELFPVAKIGRGNIVYVYEISGANWYGVADVTAVATGSGNFTSYATMPVIQTYNMDKKVDDGLPAAGNVQATYLNNSDTAVQTAPNTTVSGGTSSSCYDTTTGTYSITVNGGAGANCALSFKFQ